MRAPAMCLAVAVLALLSASLALAAPGRMLVTGCHPLAAGSDGPGLFVSDPDGYDAVRLFGTDWTDNDPWCMSNADWSPDGSALVLQYDCQIVVVELKSLLPQLFDPWWSDPPDPACCPWPSYMNANPEPIYSCGWGPRWAPTGDRIAFSNGSVCVVNPDGTGYQSLTPGGWGHLTWTADGEGIVYCDDETTGDLYLVSDIVTGPTITQLTNTPSTAEHRPEISPDGLQIAYSTGAAVGPEWDPMTDPLPAAGIRVADYPSLTGVLILTDDPLYHDYVSRWSTDGLYVYFLRSPAGDPQETALNRTLWRVRTDGSAPAEPVPGLTDWGSLWGDVAFLPQGAYVSSTYAIPGYTNVPVNVGICGVEQLAGLQLELAFRMYAPGGDFECCPLIESIDSCTKGDFISGWTLTDPIFNQVGGIMKALTYTAAPDTENVSGTGTLLELTATLLPHEQVWEQGADPVFFNDLQLSDDWGDPIGMTALPGGIAAKPFAYLELSEVPPLVLGDEEDPMPFDVTVTARGDVDEIVTGAQTEIWFYLETTITDEWERSYVWAYDAVTPTSAALADGVWSGSVTVSEPVPEGARLLVKAGDFGGYSNTFGVLGKGDVSGDAEINVFDVIKIANIAIERGSWEAWQEWAADLNGDGEVNIFDVILCANEAMNAMDTAATLSALVGALGGAAAAEATGEPVLVEVTTESNDSQTIVTVQLSDCAGVAGLQLDLSYNTHQLQSPEVLAGPDLVGRRDWTVLGHDADGVISAIAYTSSGDILSSGSGAVIRVIFEKTGRPDGKVELDSVMISNAGGTGIPVAMAGEKGKEKDKKQ